MADEVFIEGRRPAQQREIVQRALDAGVPLDSIRVAPDGKGYLVPGELGPKKRRRKAAEGEEKVAEPQLSQAPQEETPQEPSDEEAREPGEGDV